MKIGISECSIITNNDECIGCCELQTDCLYKYWFCVETFGRKSSAKSEFEIDLMKILECKFENDEIPS